jgi:PhzF family phenazine biosynthesis protein
VTINPVCYVVALPLGPMPYPVYTVDAFTPVPFAGNPAAVCLLVEARDESWMRNVAREMNLSETAFIRRPDGGDGEFELRWFTPAVEVDLCGHATLAAAHVLWEAGWLGPGDAARFRTRSGLLTAARQQDGWVEMDFPAKAPEAATAPAGLVEALGVEPVYVGLNRMDYLLEVASEAALRRIEPDFRALKAVKTRGVIVTSRADAPTYDFVSRFFAPAVGVDEDPVTGSAHCCLGPYWAAKTGKNDLVAYQASARGGVVRVGVRGGRVRLGGQAVTVVRGQIC